MEGGGGQGEPKMAGNWPLGWDVVWKVTKAITVVLSCKKLIINKGQRRKSHSFTMMVSSTVSYKPRGKDGASK